MNQYSLSFRKVTKVILVALLQFIIASPLCCWSFVNPKIQPISKWTHCARQERIVVVVATQSQQKQQPTPVIRSSSTFLNGAFKDDNAEDGMEESTTVSSLSSSSSSEVFELLSENVTTRQEKGSSTTNTNSMSSKPLDPFMVAVTRMDSETANANSVQVPLWGELLLDRSLFVLLPLAAFGLGGIVLSIYILVNSEDAFMTNLQGTSFLQMTQPPTTLDDGACRGLCSSQEESLEQIRTYMLGLTGKVEK